MIVKQIKYALFFLIFLNGVNCKEESQPLKKSSSNYFKGFDFFTLRGISPTNDTLNNSYIYFKKLSEYSYGISQYYQDCRPAINQIYYNSIEADTLFLTNRTITMADYGTIHNCIYNISYLNIPKKEMLQFTYGDNLWEQSFELLKLIVRTPTECTVYSRFPSEQKFFPDYKNKDKIIPFALFKEKRLYSYQNDTLQVVYEHYTKNELWKKSTSVFVKPQTGTWFLQWAGVPDTVLAVKVR